MVLQFKLSQRTYQSVSWESISNNLWIIKNDKIRMNMDGYKGRIQKLVAGSSAKGSLHLMTA